MWVLRDYTIKRENFVLMEWGDGECLFKDGDSAHGGAGASANFEREGDEAEPSAPNEEVEVDQVFVVGEAKLTTDFVDLVVGDMTDAGVHGFHSEGGDVLLSEPLGGSCAESGIFAPIFSTIGFAVVICI